MTQQDDRTPDPVQSEEDEAPPSWASLPFEPAKPLTAEEAAESAEYDREVARNKPE